jgi:hypothetical protein
VMVVVGGWSSGSVVVVRGRESGDVSGVVVAKVVLRPVV